MNDDEPPDISELIEFIVVVAGTLLLTVWATKIINSPDTNQPPAPINQ